MPSQASTLSELERKSGGELAIALLNTANNQVNGYNINKRFALCSTAKVITVAALLQQSSQSKLLTLKQKVHFDITELVAHSPITSQHLQDGMTLTELAEATITTSDNTAMNLILDVIGGPKAVTAFARTLGDNTFQLDRYEPALNDVSLTDKRDSSTAAAMVKSLAKILNILPTAEKLQFITWLKSSQTGNNRIRAGLPKNWIVGDKTGSCGRYGMTHDVAIVWPKDKAPLIIAVYYRHPDINAPMNEVIIAKAVELMI